MFLFLSYNAPHYPLEAPAELVYKYRRRFPKEGLFAVYAAMVEQLDSGIGRVLAALAQLGMAGETLVIFTSDNGPSAEPNTYGPEGADISNGPLRGYKFSTHEGGIRVPFLARWPGRIPAGLVCDEPAITMDLMPTILEAAGVGAPSEMQGQSLLPLLSGAAFARPEPLHWENQHNAAVLDGPWKLVHQFGAPQPFLYRIDHDSGEAHDLADRHPEKVRELLARHAQWKARHYPHPVSRALKRPSYSFPEADASLAR